IDPDDFEVADAARMSMSIPYFFEPFQLVRDRVLVEDPGDDDVFVANGLADRIDVEHENAAMRAMGRRETTFRELTERELVAQRSVIIDGGTLSNFPVWLFDVNDPGRPLRRPTFGFTLRGGQGVGGGLNAAVGRMPWAVRFGFDIFHTSQEAWDARFVSHSSRVRTVTVNAGTVGTTDFNLPVSAQDMLIENGRTAAKRFLDRFDLAAYENTFHRTFGDAGAAATPAP